jgi:hypothetical protein
MFYRIIRPEVLDLLDSARRMVGGTALPLQAVTPRACPCPKCADTTDAAVRSLEDMDYSK